MHLSLFGITLSLSASAQIPIDPTPVVPPNVLMIVLDDLGTEHLNAYQPSATNPPTPFIDALAAQGVRFTRAYGHPMCSITRAAWMTGRYPFRTGMGYIAEELGYGYYTLPNSEVFLAEMVRDGFPGSSVQYRRGAFGKWHLDGNNSQANQHAINNGFERFYGHLSNPGSHFTWPLVDASASGSTTTTIGGAGVFDTTTWSPNVIQRAATSWMNAQVDPFFAYVCFSPPHAPYEIPPFRMLSTATINAIRALSPSYVPGHRFVLDPQDPAYDPNWVLCNDWMIEALDTAIGLLVGGLDAEVRENTYVIVAGDNGSVSTLLACDLQPVAPNLTGHGKRTVYESGIRIPLIVSGPVPNPGTTSSGLVSAVDLFPTIAALIGATPPATTLDGVSVKALIDNPGATSPRPYVFAQIYTHNGVYVPNSSMPASLELHMRSLSDGEYKYLSLWSRDAVSGQPQLQWQQGFRLFDAASGTAVDPDEHCDLFAPAPSTVVFPGCLTLNCPAGTPQDLARLRFLHDEMVRLSGL
jgi:arylsulfatase A-like enzyme